MIPGVKYIPNFISDEVHDFIVHDIDSCVWLNDLKRRVQHYGYKYDYTQKKIDESMRTDGLRPWMKVIGSVFLEKQIFPEEPDQVIINEYNPGQGIYRHVDCEPCFKDIIASLSFGSGCIMEFTSLNTKQVVELYLEPKSLLVLSGEGRHRWMHGIPARKSDKGQERNRRISATFRNVIV